MDDFAERVSGIGALAETVRRRLYQYVVAQPGAVGREQAARDIGLAVHTAKFHLDRLVEDGLLEVEFRRLTGRSGPGAGRPAKLYRRAAQEISVSLPERRYDVAGRILATGVDRATESGGPVDAAVRGAAEEAGRAAGAQAEPTTGSGLDRLAAALTSYGYEPRLRDEQLVLANCPFDALMREHTRLVCGMNEAFVAGMVEGLGCRDVEARLDPEPRLCCVKARRRRVRGA